jgi:hypothetical protein
MQPYQLIKRNASFLMYKSHQRKTPIVYLLKMDWLVSRVVKISMEEKHIYTYSVLSIRQLILTQRMLIQSSTEG